MTRRPGPVVPRGLQVVQSPRSDVALGLPYATDVSFLPLRAALVTRLPEQRRVDAAGSGTSGWWRHRAVTLAQHMLGVPADWRGVVGRDLCLATASVLLSARQRAGGAVVYLSAQANPHVLKAVDLLGLPRVVVSTNRSGRMDIGELVAALRSHAGGSAVVVATIGTRLTEAADDLVSIGTGFQLVGIADRYLHVDAPLTGLPRLMLNAAWAAQLWSAADSVVFAGQCFLGTPADSTLLWHRECHRIDVDDADDGQPGLLVWHALDQLGGDGLIRRARQSLSLATYTLHRLEDLNWPAWRNEGAFTVVLRSPSAPVLRRWSMSDQQGWSRVVCMPGTTEAHIDRLVRDLARERPRTGPAPSAAAPSPARPATQEAPVRAYAIERHRPRVADLPRH